MSRIANQPVEVPSGVEIKVDGQNVRAKGSKGEMVLALHPTVKLVQEDATLSVKADDKGAIAMAGTMRSLLNNLVIGVSRGFERKLELVGVGYRAALKDKQLNLQLGYSHDINFDIPEGIKITVEKQTILKITGADKQQVGTVASKIKTFRKIEPYKGKGVREQGQYVLKKEGKKK